MTWKEYLESKGLSVDSEMTTILDTPQTEAKKEETTQTETKKEEAEPASNPAEQIQELKEINRQLALLGQPNPEPVSVEQEIDNLMREAYQYGNKADL